ncbi:hypothetical protein GOBAR_DD20753 [Gossypium barbadense]|nr:hypothetical protein GOBAR_DD20753 [Gossypium barbadense]
MRQMPLRLQNLDCCPSPKWVLKYSATDAGTDTSLAVGLRNRFRVANGSEDANQYHSREGVTNISASVNAERIEDVKQVINVGIEGCVPSKVEVIRVDTFGTNKVKQNYTITRREKWDNVLPGRLVCAEPVRKHQYFFSEPTTPMFKASSKRFLLDLKF